MYELLTYTSPPGHRADLVARFRDHSVRLLRRHGIDVVGIWTVAADDNRLVYLVRHTGDPIGNWTRFRADPEWVAARAASMVNGTLVTETVSLALEPTAFSPLH
ncbi:NIPSNAP family protein [Dactylosporangium sp. CA-152071]|uniref:NIPSNAP family protein n=1 Tax=Dactylosporangium sp. CA-152071 TaxID=3239933 RepID=UPI003D94CB7D